MPIEITILLAKVAGKFSRWFGRGEGSALPGLVAELLNPKTLSILGSGLAGNITLVTGTNGKTTTSKILREMLEGQGRQVIANQAGSNLARGIISTLLEKCDWRGRVVGFEGLFEVDEAAMPEVAAALQPKLIIVLNLFRDQLDRYGELDSTAKLLAKAIAATKADVALNADDPLVASLATSASHGSNISYFGIDANYSSPLKHDYTADSVYDPTTGAPLQYSQIYFSHLGHYQTSDGTFRRPKPNTVLTQIKQLEPTESVAVVLHADKEYLLTSALPGIYNFYNALAALDASLTLGLEPEACIESLARTTAAFGRVEAIHIRGHKVYLLLIKNPTGFNQIIQTFLLQKTQQKVLLAINDNFADGRDISWLWDAALEDLTDMKPQIICTGIRAEDMALRLKYAAIEAQVTPNLKDAINVFIDGLKDNETGYILPTYTAMLAIRELLSQEAGLARMKV